MFQTTNQQPMFQPWLTRPDNPISEAPCQQFGDVPPIQIEQILPAGLWDLGQAGHSIGHHHGVPETNPTESWDLPR